MRRKEELTFPQNTLLGLDLGFQLNGPHPDANRLRQLLHGVGEDDLGVLVGL